MKNRKLGMGLVGPGFVAPHHLDAVRRLQAIVVDPAQTAATLRADLAWTPASFAPRALLRRLVAGLLVGSGSRSA